MDEASRTKALELLRNKFPGYIFDYTPPKYVTSLHPSFVEGVHCYMPIDHKLPIESINLVERNNISDATDISGNPLTINFESLDVSVAVEGQLGKVDPSLACRSPMDNNVARQIINFCSLALKPKFEISVLAKGHNFKKVVMGFYKESGLVRTWWTDVMMDTPSTEEMLEMHQQEAGTNAKIEAVVHWSRVLHTNASDVQLHVERPELILLPPKDQKTSAKLQLAVHPGRHPALASVWRQLELLRIAVDLLRNPAQAGNAEWHGIQGLLGRNEMTTDTRIRHFLSLVVKPAKFERPVNGAVTAATAFAARRLGPLDYAWLFLAESNGAQDLHMRIDILFSASEAARREGRPVAASATSGSRVAAALAGSGGLTPKPIEILVELGLLKLCLELSQILKALIGPSELSTPPLTAVDDLLLWLYRTAATIEMLSAIEDCVKQEFLSYITSKTLMADTIDLKSQITSPWKADDPLTITAMLPVPVSQLQQNFLQQWQETKVKLTSWQSKTKIITTFLFGNSSLLPPASLCFEENNINKADHSMMPHCAHCLKMTFQELPLFSR